MKIIFKILTLLALFAALTPAPLKAHKVCTEPVPRIVKELTGRHDPQQVRETAEKLAAQHCREINEVPPSDYSEDIGGECIMYSGISGAGRLYWAICYGLAPPTSSKRCFMFQGSMYCE